MHCLAKRHKLFVIVEAKRVLSVNTANVAKSQLKRIEKFIREKIPFNDEGWKLVKTIAFSELDAESAVKIHACDLCADFLWDRNKVNLRLWWENLTAKIAAIHEESESAAMEVDGANLAFAEILKYMIFYSLKTKKHYLCDGSLTTRKVCDQLDRFIGGAKSVAFWTCQQYGLLNFQGHRAYLTAGFGSGKTVLLIHKAAEVAKKCADLDQGVKLIIVPPLKLSRVSNQKIESPTPDSVGVQSHKATLLELRLRRKLAHVENLEVVSWNDIVKELLNDRNDTSPGLFWDPSTVLSDYFTKHSTEHHFFIDEFHHLNLKRGTSPKSLSLPDVLFKKAKSGMYLWIASNPDFASLTPAEEPDEPLMRGKRRVKSAGDAAAAEGAMMRVTQLAGNLRNSYEIQVAAAKMDRIQLSEETHTARFLQGHPQSSMTLLR